MTDRSALRSFVTRLDACHAFVYFRPETAAAFAEHDVTGMDAYFATRAAPLGAVGAGTVVATFHNFSSAMVAASVPKVWEQITPATAIDARAKGADGALRSMLGDEVDGADMAELADLLEKVIDGADGAARPLYAANAELPRPPEAHLRFFQAVNLIREHRGDAHMAALMLAGIGGAEALFRDDASGMAKLPAGLVRATRGITDEEWEAAGKAVEAAGHLGEDGKLNDAGMAQREAIEAATDDASLPLWERLTETESARAMEIGERYIATIGPQMFGPR